MRWLFADPDNPDEMAYRQRTLAAIDAWWRAFQSKATDLDALFSNRSNWDLPQWMIDHLGAIHPRIMWEYGPAKRQEGHRLVITPESERWLRPVVRTLLERAPKIGAWEFYAYRLPEEVEHSIHVVEARVGVNITGAQLAASIARGRKIDLWYSFPDADFDEQTASNAAFVATESLMGEYVLDTWIGRIELWEPGATAARLLPLERAQATVGALIESIQDQLPQAGSVDISMEEGWSNVEFRRPEEATDYPDRDDLIVASTHNVDLFQAQHGGGLFTSACHSRFGELFCYLKLDGRAVPRGQFVDFRAGFEDALNPALTQAGVGGCIGGGSGLRYAYIDMALTDVNRAIPIIRQIMTEQRAPLRSWLLFFDDELSREWVGIYPHGPPPPMRAED